MGDSCGSSGPRLELLRDLLCIAPDAHRVPAPDLADLVLGVPTAHQLDRHIGGFARVVVSLYSTAAIHVRADGHVVDPDELDRVVDVVHELPDVRGWPLGVDGVELFL